MGLFRLRGRSPDQAPLPPPLRELAALELTASRLADALLAGATASVFRGSGVEPDGVRPYVPGDDVRGVDWRVTARTGRPHLRERIEERGMELHLVVDRSASLEGLPTPEPARAAVTVAAALAAAAARADHPVGLLQLTDRAEGHLPARRGERHLRALHASLVRLRPAGTGTTALAPGLRGLRSTLGARALVVVVSDFRLPAPAREPVASALASMAARHELVPVVVRTPGPEVLPAVGIVVVRDPESGRLRTLDTGDPATRGALAASAAAAEEWRRSLWAGVGVRPVEVDPFAPLALQLRAGLSRRRGRAT